MTTVVDQPSLPPPAVVLQEIPVGKLNPHPRNPRRSVGDVADMAASILKHGVLEPLIVAPATRGSSFVLIAGHRRAAAAKAAKLKMVPCLVRGDLATDRAQLEAMLVENLQRADLTPVEEAAAYEQLLLDPDLTPAALAARVGQPVKRIQDRVKLGKLDDVLKDRLHAGQLTIEQGLALVEFADDPKLSKELAKAAGSPDWSYTLSRAREQRKAARALDRRVAKLTKAGIDVVKSWPKGAHSISHDWIPDRPSLNLIPPVTSCSEQDEWVLSHHAACEGALAVVRKLYGDLVLVHACSRPDLHRPDEPEPTSPPSTGTEGAAGPSSSTEDQVDAEAQDQVREQQERDVAAATTARRDFLRAEIAGATDSDARATLMDMILAGQWTDTYTLIADLLHVEPLDPSASPDGWRDYLGPTALVKVSTPGLVILLDIVNHARGEITMANVDRYAAWTSDRWVRRLDEVYEYPWSEDELEWFRPERFRPDYVDPQACVSCGEVVELGAVEGHPDQCSLCAEADDESLVEDDTDDEDAPDA